MIYAILIVLCTYAITAFFGIKMVEEASKESENNIKYKSMADPRNTNGWRLINIQDDQRGYFVIGEHEIIRYKFRQDLVLYLSKLQDYEVLELIELNCRNK